MRKIFLLYILLGFATFSEAQQNNIWCFGDSALINFGDTTNIVIGQSASASRGTSASICDSSGHLLFYVTEDDDYKWGSVDFYNGEIINKQNHTMQNGDTIVMALWYDEAVIIPDPSNVNQYYVFSIGVTGNDGLYYSIVDMSLDSSLGALVQKNIQLLNFKMVDCLTAVKHGNGRDWWVICKKSTFGSGTANNEWYIYLVTPSGIINYGVQNYGTLNHTNSGGLCFNYDGSKICFVTLLGIIELFDFDRCTGLLSDSISIEIEQFGSASPYYWSCAFSPSGQYLYVTVNKTPSRLWQFDTWAPNIAATKTLIWETYTPPYTAGAIKLAPDNKIYMSCAWVDSLGVSYYPYDSTMYYPENMNLSVINSPDSLDSLCDFQPWSFYLGGNRTYWGLPNNPDYDMPRLQGSPCDTVQWAGINEQQAMGNGQLFVSYISDWQKAFINAQHLKGTTYTLSVIDITGRQVFKEKGRLRPPYFTKDLDCSSFSNGMYIVTVTTDKERLSKKFIKD